MEFEKYYVVANTREQFLNEVLSSRVYNDHPSKNSIDQIVSSLKSEGYNADYFGGVEKLMDAYSKKITFPKTLFLNLSDGLTQQSRKAQSAVRPSERFKNNVFKSFRWSDSTKPESTVSSLVGDAQCKVCWFRPNGFINGK